MLVMRKIEDPANPLGELVSSQPAPELFGDVPARVVPDENQHLLARRLELLQAPLEKLGGYGTHGPTVHEPYPRLIELGHIEPIAGDGFRVRVVFGDRLLNEAQRLSLLAPTVQSGQG